MNLFGKAKQSTAPSTADTIMKLRGTLQTMSKREEYLTKKIDAEKATAKKYAVQKNKRQALMCLKRKKVYEKQQEQLSNAQFQLEQQIMVLENVNIQKDVFSAFSEGARAMQRVNKDLSIDKVDEIMEDVREQMDVAQEISNALAEPMGFGQDLDEDELEAELAELEGEIVDEQMLETPAAPSYKVPATATPDIARLAPAAPRTVPEMPVADDEDDELKALEAAMMAP
eukprot:TRINITY_DN2114_c0_g1::TRINITY_DN2114_c0_g1_i1::g.12780::m.12780 TRINITY_DN2114_c0_g1::TRINITY_DN2114_c0_g1_i1::g.12780  ORF type:complete len:260 (+),score=62.55,sp/Q5XGW6/CHM4B_XENLA/41.05/3e-34,Snf7/PF03357.16/5.1e-45,Snf7/PF03357.16/7.7e+03,MutS_III/PF05192.13/0.37 TRINITY_DN2114_c0_g1_i1:99-782(+)